MPVEVGHVPSIRLLQTLSKSLEGEIQIWHPWLRINCVLRVMLQMRWSAEAWLVVRVEFRRAMALRSEIRR